MSSFALTALLSHQAADLSPPRLRQVLDLVGSLPQQSHPLLLDGDTFRLLETGQDGRVKGVLQVLLSQRRALGKSRRAELLGELLALLCAHGPLLVLRQLDQHLHVFSQVQLGAHQDQRSAGTVLPDL